MNSSLTTALYISWQQIIQIMPTVFMYIFVIVVGLLLSSLAYIVTRRILHVISLDALLQRTPLFKGLESMHVRFSVTRFIAILVFWFGIGMTAVVFFNAFVPTHVEHILAVANVYTPKILTAILIVFVSFLLAVYLESLILRLSKHISTVYAPLIAKICFVILFIVCTLFLLLQVGIRIPFIESPIFITSILIVVCITIAAAYIFRFFIQNWCMRLHLQTVLTIGSTVTIKELNGTIRGFTATGVIIHQAKMNIVVPATLFINEMYAVESV